MWLPLIRNTGDLACKPGMCPDWESNWRLFGSQASTQSTEPHQPGPLNAVFKNYSRVSHLITLTIMLNVFGDNLKWYSLK